MLRLPYVLALALALSAGVAYADDKNKDKALALFEKSDKAYKAGKFERAVKLLEEAYTLYPEPILLYNLGRAQEGLGDVRGAIASYERYLKDGKQIADRKAIERRLETLKAQEAEKASEAKRLAEEEARRKQAEEAKRLADEQRERERLRAEQLAKENERSPLEQYGSWITMGAGGALVVTGIFFGVRASTTHDDAVATPIQRDAVELQHSAERSATIANVLYVIGGATLAGGIGWKIWQIRSGKAQAQVTVAPNAVAIGGSW